MNFEHTPAVLTPATTEQIYNGCLALGHSPTTALIFTAHAALETGWFKACYNYNLGNTKATEAEPHCFFGCGEELNHVDAVELEQADPEHAQIVRTYVAHGVGMASMVFRPNHRYCCFKAYPDLATGLAAWLALLQRNYSAAYGVATAYPPTEGQVLNYVTALKAAYYFTADPKQYYTTFKGVIKMVEEKVNKVPSVTPPKGSTPPGIGPIWELDPQDTTQGARLARVYKAIAADPEYHTLLEPGTYSGDSTCAEVARAGWWHAGLPGVGRYTSGAPIYKSIIDICKGFKAWQEPTQTSFLPLGCTYYIDTPGGKAAHICNVVGISEQSSNGGQVVKTVEGGQGFKGMGVGTFLRKLVWGKGPDNKGPLGWWQGQRKLEGYSVPELMPIPTFATPVLAQALPTALPVTTAPTQGPSVTRLLPWVALVASGWAWVATRC